WSPRSSWLRYALEISARAASSRSESLASLRWARTYAPNASIWSCQGSFDTPGMLRRLSVLVGGGAVEDRRGGGEHAVEELALHLEELLGEAEARLDDLLRGRERLGERQGRDGRDGLLERGRPRLDALDHGVLGLADQLERLLLRLLGVVGVRRRHRWC